MVVSFKMQLKSSIADKEKKSNGSEILIMPGFLI
jgi:hypothetical protein